MQPILPLLREKKDIFNFYSSQMDLILNFVNINHEKLEIVSSPISSEQNEIHVYDWILIRHP